MKKIKSYKEILSIVNTLPVQNKEIKRKAIKLQNELLKPRNSLGVLEDLAIFDCSWRGVSRLKIRSMQTMVFAGI